MAVTRVEILTEAPAQFFRQTASILSRGPVGGRGPLAPDSIAARLIRYWQYLHSWVTRPDLNQTNGEWASFIRVNHMSTFINVSQSAVKINIRWIIFMRDFGLFCYTALHYITTTLHCITATLRYINTTLQYVGFIVARLAAIYRRVI